MERHAQLVLALRTAHATDLILDNEVTQSDDLLDAFGLPCHNLVTWWSNEDKEDQPEAEDEEITTSPSTTTTTNQIF